MPSTLPVHDAPTPSGIEPRRYPADRVSPKALAIYWTFERFGERKTASSKSHHEEQAALCAEKAPLQRGLQDELDERLQSTNAARVDHFKAGLAGLDAKIKANNEAHAADPLKNVIGLNQIDEGLRAHQGPLKDRNTTDTAIDGKSAEQMHEFWGDEIARLGYEIDGIWLQTVSRTEIERRIVNDVNNLCNDSVKVEGVKYVRPRGLRGRPLQGHVKFPMTFADGKEVVDLAAVLFAVPAIKKMVTDSLVKNALAGHSEANAMTPMQREQAVAAAREAQREARYKAAYWYRKLLDEGRYVPARTTDALALLDVE